MSIFSSEKELQDELSAFVADFVASEDGRQAVQRAQSLSERLTLALRSREPETVLWVDFVQGEVTVAATDQAAVSIDIHADDLHHLMMDRLGPVEISRLSETEQLKVSGAPEALAALVLLAAQAQPYYPNSLSQRGRTDLLDTPAPPSPTVWSVEGPPPPLIETRRPWQRAKPASQ